MSDPADRRDRQEAMRMFAAIALAGLLLAGAAVLGAYLISDPVAAWIDQTFGAGLGLRNAALIAMAVSFVAVIVFAIVSGGEALLLGELPFTLAGFFLFFVFFWLMLAWIF
jgi:hypothetical protein